MSRLDHRGFWPGVIWLLDGTGVNVQTVVIKHGMRRW